MKKIGIIGCKATTLFLLEALRKLVDITCVITISPESGEKNNVADYADVGIYCENQKLDLYTAARYDLKGEEDRSAFSQLQLDIAFVIGWQRIIPKEILNTFSIGVFGMHGSTDDLPIGRGRSPMNWAIIEQRKHFFTNLFKYDPGIDSGDVLDAFTFSIQKSDTSETMHYKNVLAMKKLITKNIDNLLQNKIKLNKQRELTPTYYPKRSPDDSQLDWQQDIFKLEAHIRAVTYPFNGAFTFLDNERVIIWRSAIFETDLVDYGYKNIRWGTIVERFPSGKFIIRCRGGLLIVHEYETESKIEVGKVFKTDLNQLTHFNLNSQGYHDLIEKNS